MKRITLKTKVEATLAILLLITIAAASVTSLTRTISDSYDDFETFIRNSEGNCWKCTGENVQAAIDDIGADGGKIWVGGDITLSSELKIDNVGMIDGSEYYTIIDFQGHRITLEGDMTCINLTRARHVTIENLYIKPTLKHTASIIKLYIGPEGAGNTKYIRFNTFRNINIESGGGWVPGLGWSEHNYTGIELHHNGDCSSFLCNTFENIQMEGLGTGILFNQENAAGWANGNYFENIWLDQYVTAIHFKRNPSAQFSFNQNVFTHIKAQTAAFTEYGVRNICGNGNHFDHILMWDWYAAHTSGSAVYEYSIDNSASSTYINAHVWHDNGLYVNDEGSNTMLIANGKIQIGG